MADVRTSAVAEAVTGAFDHQAVYEEVKNKPLRVRRVDASRGLQRTRQYIVDRLLEPLYDADTLEQLNQIANDVTEGLLELGIFDTVQALIKESEPVRALDHLMPLTGSIKSLSLVHTAAAHPRHLRYGIQLPGEGLEGAARWRVCHGPRRSVQTIFQDLEHATGSGVAGSIILPLTLTSELPA